MMTKEQLMALGMTEEQADKVITGYKEMIPKSRFDEVNNAKKQLETDIADRDAQLVMLGETVGVSEELKNRIATLQKDNQEAADKHAAEMKELTMNNAIKLALAGKVHDEGMAAGQFDREKLVIDGEKIIGLDDQLASLKESKPFLFKPEDTPPADTPSPGFQIGVDGKHIPADHSPTSLQDAIAARFAANTQ